MKTLIFVTIAPLILVCSLLQAGEINNHSGRSQGNASVGVNPDSGKGLYNLHRTFHSFESGNYRLYPGSVHRWNRSYQRTNQRKTAYEPLNPFVIRW